MIGNLLNCFKAFKTKMEFQGIGFEGDKTRLNAEKLKHFEVEVTGQRSHTFPTFHAFIYS